MTLLLFTSVFVIATCGLIYELIAGTLASYLLGDSITQFSTIIGCYLFSMGIGSWLSAYVQRNLLAFFIKVEILVGLIGGCSAALLFSLFEHVYSFHLLLYFVVAIIGILVGIEIPLLLRILKDRLEFKELVSRVFTFDYIGALFASILFPLVLVPHLGLIRSAFLFGIFNSAVAIWVLYAIKEKIPNRTQHKFLAILVLLLLVFGFIYSDNIVNSSESAAYPGAIIYAKSTPYQRIVLTRQKDDLRLFLNSNLQFSSLDEYRYHEALVHPIMAALKHPKKILIIGGGDGLALREVLKYDDVQQVVMVDLDAAMTKLFSSNKMLTQLNQNSLSSPKLKIYNEDAFLWLRNLSQNKTETKFDAIIIDVPDPSNFSVGKLYSLTFFKLLRNIINKDALIVVQSTSPLVARKSFWCVHNTMQAAGYRTTPYHAYVPSFGEWGFIIASNTAYQAPQSYLGNLQFINSATFTEMLHFPKDMEHLDTKIQSLDDQALIHYFDEEWSKYLIY